MLERDVALVQVGEERLEVGVDGGERRLVVRGEQAVVDAEDDFVGAEADAAERRVGLELRGGLERGAEDGGQALAERRRAGDRLLADVEHAGAVLLVVEVDVRLVRDEHGARPVGHVVVVGDVDQQVVGQRLVADPAWKTGTNASPGTPVAPSAKSLTMSL